MDLEAYTVAADGPRKATQCPCLFDGAAEAKRLFLSVKGRGTIFITGGDVKLDLDFQVRY